MALPHYQTEPPTRYSTLEVASSQYPQPHTDDKDLQSKQLDGDDTLSVEEVNRVVSDEGLQSQQSNGGETPIEKETKRVVGDKKIKVLHKERPDAMTSDLEGAHSGEWRKRRVCGLPTLVMAVLGLLLLIGGAVGGALGGTLGKKKDNTFATTTLMTTRPIENVWYKL